MATRALITAEQYLSMRFEREPELVYGELAEKSLPNKSHGRTQQRLAVLLDGAGYCCTEVRVRLAEDLYRIPDVALFQNGDPGEEIPTSPPLVVVEITSPDDRIHDILQKLAEYQAWGVQHIWLIEPELKECYIYRGSSLNHVSQLELPELQFSLQAAELFA